MKKRNILLFVIIFVLIVLLTILSIRYFKNMDKKNNFNVENVENSETKEEKKLQIYNGFDRVIAVTIDNEQPAWPHSGLQDAYMIYEMIIEGGETRMLALFKGANTQKIGPIRSARHYFVEYAMEHNAIFAHFGWSPLAEKMINSNNVDNINGIYDNYFWRIGSRLS